MPLILLQVICKEIGLESNVTCFRFLGYRLSNWRLLAEILSLIEHGQILIEKRVVALLLERIVN